MKRLIASFTLLLTVITAQAEDVKLPPPVKTGGKPFMEAVSARHSTHDYVKKALPPQMLSNLLWAAYGYNRFGKRTIATAYNRQEMDIYVVFEKGAYFYDALTNTLQQVAFGDIREALGQSSVSNSATLSIVMVADTNKSSLDYARIATGSISQTIYLFAASEGLGSLARGSFKAKELSKALNLDSNQVITLVQAVGFVK